MNIGQQKLAMDLGYAPRFSSPTPDEETSSDFNDLLLEMQSPQQSEIPSDSSKMEETEENSTLSLSQLKTQLDILAKFKYSRTQFEKMQDKEAEEERWEKLLEFVDTHIQKMDIPKDEPDFTFHSENISPDLLAVISENYDLDNMNQEEFEDLLADLLKLVCFNMLMGKIESQEKLH